jgi:peptidoglycan/LPS O-acetylase OafA/YrhL
VRDVEVGYNIVRPHSALGNLPPAIYAKVTAPEMQRDGILRIETSAARLVAPPSQQTQIKRRLCPSGSETHQRYSGAGYGIVVQLSVILGGYRSSAVSRDPMHKIPQIQIARAVAALTVTYFHSYTAIRWYSEGSLVPVPLLAQWGFWGVDLFFVISGFIIALVVDTPRFSPRDFLIKRAFRIYPLYWIFIAVAMGLAIDGVSPFGSPIGSLWNVLANFALFPVPSPIYGVGWSLQHEIAFYLLATLSVPALGLRGLLLILIALGVVGQFAAPTWDVVLFSPHQFEFALGIALYLARTRLQLAGVALPLACAVGCFALAIRGFWGLGHIPACGFVLWALLNVDGKRAAFIPLVKIGDASYSQYLVHSAVFYCAPYIANAVNQPEWAAEAFRAVMIFTSVGLSLLMFRFIETPLIGTGHDLAAARHPDTLRYRKRPLCRAHDRGRTRPVQQARYD